MSKPSGYPTTVFQEVDPKFLCVYCTCVLKVPIQSYCGHRYCKDCIEYIIKYENSKLCPGCINEGGTSDVPSLAMEQTFPDNAIKREFNSMNARCPFENCIWSGLFKDFETHYATCEHREVECQCGTNYPFSRQRQHLENECTFREVNCPNCNDSVLFKDLDNPAESLAKHLENDVAGHLSIVARRIGHVESIVGLNDSPYPIQESLIKKLSTVENKLQSISPQGNLLFNKSNYSVVAAASGRETQATLTATGPSVISLVKAKLELHEGVMTVLNREVEKLTLKMNSMQRERRHEAEQLDAMDRKIKLLERSEAMKDATISELNIRINALEQTSYDGTLLWRIDDFARKRQEAISGRAESIFSPPFRSSKAGYKLRARIYLNGDGDGQGTHVSVSFHVLKGQYDSLLKWPFRQKVTFTLISQNQENGEYGNVVDSILPSPASCSFRRPRNDMNSDEDSICPLFAALTLLDNPAADYVKDDTAFLKIVVSSEDNSGSNSDNEASVDNFQTA